MQKLDEFILNNQLIKSSDYLLVAVSGGMDSMFLLTYLHSKNYALAVAHCNFGLRGAESDLDEAHVQTFCELHSIPFHTKKFETALYANENSISIQMAARDLRYMWFNELCEALYDGKPKIVTAHHKSDHAETILINMLRGTGLKGLEGIAHISQNVIRPMLCLSRLEVKNAVADLNIIFREDQSNESDKYHRNRLRLNVIPELKKINPDLENTFLSNSKIVQQANNFIDYYMETIEKEIVSVQNKQTHVDVNELLKKPEPKFILYTFLVKFGFNAASVDDIYLAMNGLSGKQFLSDSHRLIINRGQLILKKHPQSCLDTYQVNKDTTHLYTPHHLWNFKITTKDWIIPDSNQEVLIDFDHLRFPLSIRPWQQGDKIRILGMKGHKKISDILIDKKLSLFEKEQIWVLISDDKILWVSGIALSEECKVCESTKKVLAITIANSLTSI